jgi:hypothetical protein
MLKGDSQPSSSMFMHLSNNITNAVIWVLESKAVSCVQKMK